jgi:outer membrane cobalamin receptor
MSVHRPVRPAVAGRPILIGSFVAALTGASVHAEVRGQVVDATGQPLPRAYVRAVHANGATAVYTDERGHFTLPDATSCTLHVTLTGFQPATLPCTPASQRVELAILPVRETVMVTATRTEAPASQAGASATIVTSDDLERRQEPLLADLLVFTPGAMLMRNGASGAVTSLFVRGGESDYNKVLLDGVPLNEPGGTFFLNNLTTENLERIEIVRGAYSTLFGSDAMASVIQLITKRGDRTARRPRVSAQVDGGTYGTVHANAAISGGIGRIDYSVAGARLDTDNRVPNSALANTTISGSVGVALAETATLRFVGRGEREHVGTPGPTAFGRPDRDAFFKRRDGIGSLMFDHRPNPRFRERAAYSLATSYQQSTNLLQDEPYTASYKGRIGVFRSSDFLNDSVNDLRRHHAEYQVDLGLANGARLGTQTLTLLADWDGERATVTNRLTGTRTDNARDNGGASVQQQMLWRRVFLTVGARVERNESFGGAFVPRGTAVFVVRESSGLAGETRVKASAGTGIKEPTLAESFSVSTFARGNPDLKPERSRSAELGVEQRLAGDRVKAELTYFDNRFEDVIQLVTTDPATFAGQYFNTGITRARGLEVAAEAAPVSWLRARAAYTLLDGKVVASAVPSDRVFRLGAELFRRPRHSGAIGITTTWERLFADLNGVFVGRFVDDDFGLFNPSFTESPGHTVWDARFGVRINRQLTGLISIDNLTNQDYSEPLGYQPLLRTVRAGIRVGF